MIAFIMRLIAWFKHIFMLLTAKDGDVENGYMHLPSMKVDGDGYSPMKADVDKKGYAHFD